MGCGASSKTKHQAPEVLTENKEADKSKPRDASVLNEAQSNGSSLEVARKLSDVGSQHQSREQEAQFVEVLQTMRRRGAVLSLPPALQNVDAASRACLQDCRARLKSQNGLSLLFRLPESFVIKADEGIFSLKEEAIIFGGDQSALKLGTLALADVLATPSLAVLQTRLQWSSTDWLESHNWLDGEGLCHVKVFCKGSTFDLCVRPTSLAYAISELGFRLGLCSGSASTPRCMASVVETLEDGAISVRVDNGDTEIIDPDPINVVVALRYRYDQGVQLLLAHDGVFVDAQVSAWHGHCFGNRHTLTLKNSSSNIDVDLNELNHCVNHFEDAASFQAAQVAYCSSILTDFAFVEDGITGNRLHIEEQTVFIKTISLEELQNEKDKSERGYIDSASQLSFDQVQWQYRRRLIGGDRVWANNEEGRISQKDEQTLEGDDDDRHVVEWATGACSAPMKSDRILKATVVKGIKAEAFEKVTDIPSFIPLLAISSLHRSQGARTGHPVLVRAGPGTGKTWSMQQLLYLLAKQCQADLQNTSSKSASVPIPLLIPVQRLSQMLRQQAGSSQLAGVASERLVLFYIRNNFEGPVRSMLEQAYEMRNVMVIMDGIDEASDLKHAIEDFIFYRLVPMGLPLIVTSRPEGVRLRLYANDFVIMDLQPLNVEQQDTILKVQLKENVFFRNLMAFSTIRKRHDQIYVEEAFADDRDRVFLQRQLPNKDLFVVGTGYNPQMRQSCIDGSRFIQLNVGEPQSEFLRFHGPLFTTKIAPKIDALIAQEADMPQEQKEKLVELTVKDMLLSTCDAAQAAGVASLARKLYLLVSKYQAKPPKSRPGHASMVTAVSLWPEVVAATDELLFVGEQLRPAFKEAAERLLQKAGFEVEETFQLGPMKDPVRMYEKAREDYASRFDDGVIAEANLVDVLRARFLCKSGSKMKKLLEFLMRGFKVDIQGKLAQLDLIRVKNKFATLDPPHFRTILCNLCFTYNGASHFLELQVHHVSIIGYNEESHAHDHYDFFRAHLANKYDTVLSEQLDMMLEKRLELFDSICKVPVLLSVLVCALAGGGGGNHGMLPYDLFELYCAGLSNTLSRSLKGNGSVQLMTYILKRIAVRNHMAQERTFFLEDVKELSNSTGRPEILQLWMERMALEDLPLVKILARGADSGEFQFRHLSFQEALFAQALIDAEVPDFWTKAVQNTSASDAENKHPTEPLLSERLKTPFYLNMFRIGGRYVGNAYAKIQPELNFDGELDDCSSKALLEFAVAEDLMLAPSLINAEFGDGFTSLLMSAVISKKEDMALKLIEAGSDIHKTDESGFNVIALSSMFGLTDVVERLMQLKADPSLVAAVHQRDSLAVGVLQGHYGVVELLLASGMAVNKQAGRDQTTPLMIAASQGQLGMTELLLAHKADISLKNIVGKTATDMCENRVPCPSNCGFMVTWHEKFCCVACELTQGAHHGLLCDRVEHDTIQQWMDRRDVPQLVKLLRSCEFSQRDPK